MKAMLRLLLATLLASLAGLVQAHEMTLAEMTMRETAPGQFVYAWGAPAKTTPIAQELKPVWPEGCEADAQVVSCGPRGLAGTFAVEGVGQAYSAAIVRIVWRDGQQSVVTVSGSQPTVQLFGGASDERGGFELAKLYTVLGVEHILSGIDHLMFVIGLLFLVGLNRRLIGTITAFTAAHSLTLAASALGMLTLRPPPVEACIALSIVLVAGEALRDRQSLSRRWPALVAFLFGLVHGLGFAGALKDIGLPQHNITVALLGFNVGVEAGQLAVVGVAWGAARLLGRLQGLRSLRQPALYVIGSVAAYWSLTRIVAIAH
ncbi:HupE/UreJ family protein [Xylophilus sp. GOD-11R]|uniref:HupE/UreJ family protein n=1 Tax=Xylophilus sp. GOD-11R TaxID=3089814 RepID=UPI00298C46D8|nr:HupE/UreJ family protein [Xylophilus sp. GOD-11R]WPB56254.1 HupE/UreJ family protein [Xylophilus sp. GOD-11R]